MQEWYQEAIKLKDRGVSIREVARTLGKPYTSVWEALNTKKETDAPRFTVERDTVKGNILLISDMHIPYHHKDTLDFLSDLNKEYKPKKIICLGDECDKHNLSFHPSDPDLYSAGDEIKAALPVIRSLKKLFPKMDLLESNHGSLVYRKAKHHGIPAHYLKSYNDVLEVGEDWRWHFDMTIRLPTGLDCYLHHGKVKDAIKLSQMMGCCAIEGHFHESFAIQYWSSPTALYWAMNCGCLADDKSLAMSYNNVNVKRPIIGTGVIVEGMPVLVPMKL